MPYNTVYCNLYCPLPSYLVLRRIHVGPEEKRSSVVGDVVIQTVEVVH